MSDCDVCLVFDGDPAEFFSVKEVTGRKEHKCSECDRAIPVGTKHQVASMKCDGEFSSYRTCLVCAEIRKAFCCDAEVFGGVFWSEMADYGFPEISKSGDCLKKLTTPEAKRYFAERYRQWKESRAA